MSKELIDIIEAWISDPEIEGHDATATLAVLVSQLPADLVNNVPISLISLLEAIKAGNN